MLVVDVVPAADGAADGDTDCCGDVDVCLLDAGAGAAGGVESMSIFDWTRFAGRRSVYMDEAKYIACVFETVGCREESELRAVG